MGTSTSILVGVYLECTMSKQQRMDSDPTPVCSRNKKHGVSYAGKFCQTCGAKVDSTPKMVDQFISFHDILNGNVERQGSSEASTQEMLDEFDPLQGEWVGEYRDHIDLVGYYMDRIDADSEGTHPLTDLKHGYDEPPQELIDKLTALVGYTKVVVKYGVLVEVA
jgi:hypothetical protein